MEGNLLMTKGQSGILYLQRDKLNLYAPDLPSVYQFTFETDAILHTDIINKEILDTRIKQFLDTNKITSRNLAIILSNDTLFIKEFSKSSAKDQANKKPQKSAQTTGTSANQSASPTAPQEDLETSIKNYLDAVPFEDIISKRYPIQNGIRVLAANSNFYQAIKSVFEKYDFHIDLVIPAFLYEPKIKLTSDLNKETANMVFKKLDSFKQENLLASKTNIEIQAQAEQAANTDTISLSPPAAKKSSGNLRVFILLGIFVILIGVLIAVYIISNQSPSKPAVTTPSVVVSSPTLLPPIVTPEASSSAALISSSSALLKEKSLTVTIINTSNTAKQVNILKESLTQSGYKKVTVQDSSSTTSLKTVINFSKKVPQDIRDEILSIIGKFTTDTIVHEDTSVTGYRVDILLVKLNL